MKATFGETGEQEQADLALEQAKTGSATQNATALTPAAWALALAYRDVLARREAA